MASVEQAFDTVGQRYGSFVLKRRVPIEELQCVLLELEHEPTGAQVMHIANDDQENLFCLSLRTLPKTSNGVAHILEHTVLCGSEKFPINDPFFCMTRRSLNTFMNALTGSDFTCYPAASQVPKDFYNLLDVYIDAVFRPHLKELSFLQEGHRLEFTNPQDSDSSLQYKGIVFNEMKGAMSTPEARIWEAMYETLYPNLTYGINSGGDPAVIPELSYQELLDFHSTYYHPSRCLFFFYGNMPLRQHLDFIETHALQKVKRQEQLPPLPPQPRRKHPISQNLAYPLAKESMSDDKCLLALGWLTCAISEQKDLLALNVLENALMGTDAAPLKRALLASGLCKQAATYMDDDNSEIPFLVLMKGCKESDADALEHVLRDTLEKLASEGIPEHLVESALHQVEIHRSEITGDGAPFGLTLFMRSALLRQHGVDPEKGMMIHSLFDELRQELKNPAFLPSLLRKYLLDNPHCTRLLMTPDPELSSKETQEEQDRLERLKNGLDSTHKEAIIKTTDELKKFQASQEKQNVEVLPKVTLADVPKESVHYPLNRETAGNIEVFHHECFTNHLTYVDMVFDLPAIAEKDLPYLRLLSHIYTGMGCGNRDYSSALAFQHEHTGGVHAMLSLDSQAEDKDSFRPAFHLQGKALTHKQDKLMEIMQDFLATPILNDKERLKELILKQYSALESALTHKALRYAINLSASGLSLSARVSYAWSGLEYYSTIKQLATNWDKEADKLIQKLEHIQNSLAAPDSLHLVLGCDSAAYQQLKKQDFYGLTKRPQQAHQPWLADYKLEPIEAQARIIASPVAFTAWVFPTISYTHTDAAAVCLSSFLFDNIILHRRIREEGGAYGGGAHFSMLSGKFYFFGYRDPHITHTLQAFQEAVDTIGKGQFEARHLEEAKLEMIQSLDNPVSPGSRASVAYNWWRTGLTQEKRQHFRNRILNTTQEDIKNAIEKHIKNNMHLGKPVSFTSKELATKENQLLKDAKLPTLQIHSL